MRSQFVNYFLFDSLSIMSTLKIVSLFLVILTLTYCSGSDSDSPSSEIKDLRVLSHQDGDFVNSFAITLQGECTSKTKVIVSGDITEVSVDVPCVKSSFRSTLNLTNGEGEKSLTVKQSDSDDIIEIQLTVDVTSPDAPTVTGVASGATLNRRTQDISGVCEENAKIHISGNILFSPVIVDCSSSGDYSVNIEFVNPDGSNSFSVLQIDQASNSSAAVNLTVTVDTNIPSAPIVTLPASDNFLTKNTAQTVSGTCEPLSVINITGDITGALPLVLNCDEHGEFSRAVTLTTGDGTKALSFVLTDAANNTSDPRIFNFVLDTTRPANPVFTRPSNVGGGAYRVNLLDQIVSGTCEAGATVNITVEVVLAVNDRPTSEYSTLCKTDNTFSKEISLSPAVNGTNISVKLRQIDVAGNESPGIASRSFQLDLDAPRAPGGSIDLLPGKDIRDRWYINNENLTINIGCEGSPFPQMVGSLHIYGDFIESPINMPCASNGQTPLPVVLTPGDGEKIIMISETDFAGNVSAEGRVGNNSNNILTLDKTPPGPPEFIDLIDGQTLPNNRITVFVSCERNSTVTFTGDFTSSPRVERCGAGSDAAASVEIWLTEPTGSEITASQVDRAGNPGTSSATIHLKY